MKQPALAAVATGLALAGCATSGTADDARYYRCFVERAAGPGTLQMIVDVERDGRRQDHYFSWALRPPRRGVRLRIEWANVAPMTTSDALIATFTFRRPARARYVRLALMQADPARSRTITGPTYGPDQRSASLSVDLGHIRDFLGDASVLKVGAIDRRGRLVAEDRVEAAVFETAAREIAAALPEIEAMAADYRNRCALAGPDRVLLT
jgi:hypothetical protein